MCQLEVLIELIILLQFLCVSRAKVELDTLQTSGSKGNLGLERRQARPAQGSVGSAGRSARDVEKCPRGQRTLSIIQRRRAEDWELTV